MFIILSHLPSDTHIQTTHSVSAFPLPVHPHSHFPHSSMHMERPEEAIKREREEGPLYIPVVVTLLNTVSRSSKAEAGLSPQKLGGQLRSQISTSLSPQMLSRNNNSQAEPSWQITTCHAPEFLWDKFFTMVVWPKTITITSTRDQLLHLLTLNILPS